MLRAIAPTPGHRTHQRENTDADHYARPAGVHNRPHSHLLSRYQDKRYPGPRRGNTDREFLNDPATEGSRQRNCNVNLDELRSGRPDWPVLTGFLFCGHLWADRRHEGTCVQREWSRRAEVLIPEGSEAATFSASWLFAAVYPEAVNRRLDRLADMATPRRR